jgi:hypothetical protein
MIVRLEEFWQWFDAQASSLVSKDEQAIADELQGALSTLDEAISVEVASVTSGEHKVKEVIISASGDRSVAQMVKALVAACPKYSDWHFVALKPQRGFDFEVNVEGQRVVASKLFFDPMVSSRRPELLGVLVYCPDDVSRAKNASDLMRLVLETGIGEEAASEIATVEVESDSKRPSGALPINELGAYIKWRASKSR